VSESRAIHAAVQSSLREADAAIARQDWSGANRLLRVGLETLGERYVSPTVIDETGMKLVAADAEERAGRLDNAVSMRRRILQTRLELFQAKAAGTPSK
jgi:hypothetical protein